MDRKNKIVCEDGQLKIKEKKMESTQKYTDSVARF